MECPFATGESLLVSCKECLTLSKKGPSVGNHCSFIAVFSPEDPVTNKGLDPTGAHGRILTELCSLPIYLLDMVFCYVRSTLNAER